ncbi:hypothetical protein GCM10010129_77830 [Streptomyces fumigatiscleroticus]|nr:hypothetical protein GCM10010129_77830 [Streptomyces fumigatiscleroticus]
MPTRKIGIRLMVGPGCSTPSRPAPQPHWKTITTEPSVASTDSRNPKAALTGTGTERETASSRSSQDHDDGQTGDERVLKRLRDVDVHRGAAGDLEGRARLPLQIRALRTDGL